jgi:hypothetical protein
MAIKLDSTIANVTPDDLIAGVSPATSAFAVTIAANQGVLKRGSVLVPGENGMTLIATATTGTANCILADDVNTDGDETVIGTAYRAGHFVADKLIVADGYELTAADKENLRGKGILLSDAYSDIQG